MSLFKKYKVTKSDGTTDPNAFYFVLRLDTDPIARSAAKHYAQRCSDRELGQELWNTTRDFDLLSEEGRLRPLVLVHSVKGTMVKVRTKVDGRAFNAKGVICAFSEGKAKAKVTITEGGFVGDKNDLIGIDLWFEEKELFKWLKK